MFDTDFVCSASLLSDTSSKKSRVARHKKALQGPLSTLINTGLAVKHRDKFVPRRFALPLFQAYTKDPRASSACLRDAALNKEQA